MIARLSLRTVPVLLLALAVAVTAAHPALPTEASLREAWEKVQREDPKTEVFQKTSEETYRFKTRRFPFDGELRLLSLEVGEPAGPLGDERFVAGTVTVELVGDSGEIGRLHPQAYALWLATNTLTFEERSGRWLTAKEFSARLRERAPCPPSAVGFLSANLFWILFLALLVFFFTLLARRTRRQMSAALAAQGRALANQARAMEIAERGLAVAEDSNRLLREIRDGAAGAAPKRPGGEP